mmetsp:Transcript_24558/g.78942  ORF Transcript_24558/g.78942 Transcript_24558/m.78942 type:complete len:200 (+) Transcript_24558:1855-2454(+)
MYGSSTEVPANTTVQRERTRMRTRNQQSTCGTALQFTHYTTAGYDLRPPAPCEERRLGVRIISMTDTATASVSVFPARASGGDKRARLPTGSQLRMVMRETGTGVRARRDEVRCTREAPVKSCSISRCAVRTSVVGTRPSRRSRHAATRRLKLKQRESAPTHRPRPPPASSTPSRERQTRWWAGVLAASDSTQRARGRA